MYLLLYIIQPPKTDDSEILRLERLFNNVLFLKNKKQRGNISKSFCNWSFIKLSDLSLYSTLHVACYMFRFPLILFV